MKVYVGTPEALGAHAADRVQQLLAARPNAVLGLATGSSPQPLYDALISRYERWELSFHAASAFTLDEYIGLSLGHPCSYREVIQHDFAGRVDFAEGAVRSPDVHAADLDAACQAYEQQIAQSGGVDVQVLGVGANGHIAFNEPGSARDSRTRVMALAQQTRHDNARFFGGSVDQVPTECVTQGLATIMAAREILLFAAGVEKAIAIRELVEGDSSLEWPVTILQAHPRVTVLLDVAAASQLSECSVQPIDHARLAQVPA